MPKKDLIGQKFGKLTVLRDSGERASNGGVLWECQCECGNTVKVVGSNLTRKKHPTQSCGCKTNSKDLTGQKFNSLLALRPTDKRTNQKVVWECLCDCGKIHYVNSANLINGSVKSCGKCVEPKPKPIPKDEQMIGLRFNNWLILEATPERRSSYIVYKCQCDCGNIEYKTINEVNSVQGKFCKKCRFRDLTGEKFTLLTPIQYLGKSMWLCKCDCGQSTIVESSNLVTGNTKSCGCLRESAGELTIKNLLTSLNIEFETQKTFKSCMFKDSLLPARFDFYLPTYNILLEYDGIQHFKPNHWEPLEKVQERDAYKNQWCKENNIPLIRIPYTDYTKLSEEYLLNLINKGS